MKFTKTEILDVYIIEPSVFGDDRGYFFESFNQEKINEAIGRHVSFVQDNQSKSKKGVLRGLHYQEEPYAQGKLVRVIRGKIFDVAVDVRKDSHSYGAFVAETLSAENKKNLWIPEGFAHGFLALTDNVELIYKVTNYYSKEHERTYKWDDQKLNINWPANKVKIILSQKDQDGLLFDI